MSWEGFYSSWGLSSIAQHLLPQHQKANSAGKSAICFPLYEEQGSYMMGNLFAFDIARVALILRRGHGSVVIAR